MKRIWLGLASTASVVALLFGYHTSTSGALSSAGAPTVGTAPLGRSGSAPTSGTPSGAGDTVTGPAVDTRFGPVQVEVTTDGSSIAGVSVLQYPHGSPRDQEINGYALPILIDDTLSAQSAQVDMVSGATYTSEGYLSSLQAALDQAGL